MVKDASSSSSPLGRMESMTVLCIASAPRQRVSIDLASVRGCGAKVPEEDNAPTTSKPLSILWVTFVSVWKTRFVHELAEEKQPQARKDARSVCMLRCSSLSRASRPSARLLHLSSVERQCSLTEVGPILRVLVMAIFTLSSAASMLNGWVMPVASCTCSEGVLSTPTLATKSPSRR